MEAQEQSVPADRNIVFVHGINSEGPETFSVMEAAFMAAGWPGERLHIYRYDFNKALRYNGKKLAACLAQHFATTEVVLVCHSMGGLIARLAVLEGASPNIKMLVMLATPNFGALQDAQVGQLMQPFMRAGRTFIGWRPRKPGIRDLMAVPAIFEEVFKSGNRSTRVDYVTIPGTFFHKLRSDWNLPDDGKMGRLFATLNLGAAVGVALAPLFSIAMPKPHDGIVTERSNAFVPIEAGYDAEKNGSINARSSVAPTYLHIRPRVSSELHHCNITHRQEIIELVQSLARSPSLGKWLSNLPASAFDELTILPK